jgi:hypothetical protein
LEGRHIRYIYRAAYRILGIVHRPDDPDLLLLERTSPDVRAYLTRNFDAHWTLHDRQAALGFLILQRFFVGGATTQDTPEARAAEIRADIDRTIGLTRQRRARSGHQDPVLIIEVQGDIDATLRNPTQFDDFFVCFDAFDRSALASALEPEIASILVALRIGGTRPYEYEPFGSGVYLLDESGAIVHSLSAEIGSPTVYVSTSLTPTDVNRIDRDVELLIAHRRNLGRIVELFVESLDIRAHPVLRFLSAWTALEILINKLFKDYEQELHSDLRGRRAAPGLTRYLDRVKEVMRDKHRLADKVAVLSIFLDPEPGNDPVSEFRRLKEVRDGLHRRFTPWKSGERPPSSFRGSRAAREVFAATRSTQ